MPQFSYKARRRSGEVVQGVLDVADRSAALAQIERLGLFPVAVDMPKGAGAAKSEKSRNGSSSFAALLPPTMREAMTRKRKPRLQELATFTQQLANLLQAGMPLTVALNSMTHLETKGIPKEVSSGLRQEVMEGRSLSDSMSKQPLIFSELYVNMVRAGEQSGALVDVLRRMANHFERYAEVQGKLKSALIYPVMVCLVGVGLMLFFIYFMLPQFEKMFSGFNVELPMPTKFLIGVGKVFTNVWWMSLLLMVLVAVAILLYRFRRSTEGRQRIDRWVLKMPILGKVICLNYYGQFARTLSTLLENGVPVLTALKITEQVMSNGVIKEAISKTREAVTDGKTLAQPLAASKVFPQLMVDLVKIGEETGDVPAALKNVADTYDSELTIALRVMMTLIEPLLIIIMAIGVGFLLLSVLLPMFRLISNISGGMGG
ncbi:MAG TPA: type II secretion system F family protein [Verrucomicrobiae bacterium]|nr:type II secretion system F family protein [Verrucomicrobiae bacterium]